MYPWFFLAGSLVTAVCRRGVLNTTGALVFNRADVSTVHLCHHGIREKTAVLRASRPRLLYRLNAVGAAVLSRVAERWCYRPRRTRKLVAVSREVADELSRWLPDAPTPVDVIPNGVDRDKYVPNDEARTRIRSRLGIDDEQLVALFVGGEWEGKGLRFALDAMAAASEWHLVVVGRGDVRRYRRRADEVAPGRVSFVGERDDTTPYYAAADVFLLPSAYEAFPVSLLEAASAGLPVLVTRVGGAEDMVTHGQNGWFIERDAEVIAERLRQLGSDQESMEEMGAAARETTRQMSWGSVVGAYADLYRDLARRPQA
jgi:UDP-glucose:(heptosyl)LPS alpha-1,3-glucosyltransferase